MLFCSPSCCQRAPASAARTRTLHHVSLVRKTLARWQRARQSTATSTTQRAQDLARTGSAIIHDHGWSSVNLAWMPGGPRNATPASRTCARGSARMRPRNLDAKALQNTKRKFARADDGQITSDFAQRAADTPFNARNFRAWRRGSSVSRTLHAVAPQLVRRHPRHLTVDDCSNQMVPGSIPGGRMRAACCEAHGGLIAQLVRAYG